MAKLNHNDVPFIGSQAPDLLEREKFIQRICNTISQCQPPKGIAINGYWGSGKTSTLAQLFYSLSGEIPPTALGGQDDLTVPESTHDTGIVPVWFEAWRYQHEQQPIVALLHEVREQMSMWQQIREKINKTGEVALYGVLSAFDGVIKSASGGLFTAGVGDFQAAGERWEARHQTTPLATQTMHKLLENAIDSALHASTQKKQKLVIFIDDLDRCYPQAALKLLEGIKVYLNLKNCVTVFAMDQRQIEVALQQALGLAQTGDYERAHQGREYLEKICQDIFHLPLPSQTAKTEFFLHYLKVLDPDTDNPWTQHLNGLREVLKRYDCLPANPRKIKALVNRTAVLLHQMDLGNGGEAISASSRVKKTYALLLVVVIIYCFHRRLYEQLDKNSRYFNDTMSYAKEDESWETLLTNPAYEPMKDIKPSMQGNRSLPVNPSDSNIFRLHQLLRDLDEATIIDDDIKKFFTVGAIR